MLLWHRFLTYFSFLFLVLLLVENHGSDGGLPGWNSQSFAIPEVASANYSNACTVNIGLRSYDLSELVMLTYASETGTQSSYIVSACDDILPSNVMPPCMHELTSAVLQQTGETCTSLGVFKTRSLMSTTRGLELSFYNGTACGMGLQQNRFVVINIECANVPHPTVVRVTESGDNCSQYIRLRARAGCPQGCIRDAVGTVCRGKGVCVIEGLDGPAQCEHVNEGKGKLSAITKENFPLFLFLAWIFYRIFIFEHSVDSLGSQCSFLEIVLCVLCLVVFIYFRYVAVSPIMIEQVVPFRLKENILNSNYHAEPNTTIDGCVRFPGTPGNHEDLELVPAMWSTVYPSRPWHRLFQTCVYQRHDPSAPAFVPNQGFEAGIYLRYIVDHYDTLPSVIAFVQEDAGDDIGSQLSCLRLNHDWGWTPLNLYFFGTRDISMWRKFAGNGDAVHACWTRLAADFNVLLPVDADPVVSSYCCAYFAVTRDQVHRHSRASYVAAYERIVLATRCFSDTVWQGRNITNFGNDKDTSAGAFEHLQHTLLGGQSLRLEPFSQAEWCKRFLPVSSCPGSPCLSN